MSYTPVANNEIDFELQAYTPVANNEIDFELSVEPPPPVVKANIILMSRHF